MGNSNSNAKTLDSKAVNTLEQLVQPNSSTLNNVNVETTFDEDLEEVIKEKPILPKIVATETVKTTINKPTGITNVNKTISLEEVNNRLGNGENNKVNNQFVNQVETTDELVGGKKRYEKYDVFKMMKKLEDGLKGGADVDEVSISSDNEALEHIKKVITKQLKELKQTKQMGAGSCGCEQSRVNSKKGGYYESDSSTSTDSSVDTSDSSYTTSESSEYGKRKSKKDKSKKSKKNKFVETSSSNFIVDSSQTGGDEDEEVSSRPRNRRGKQYDDDNDEEEVEIETTNDEVSDEGLSIFPFNSSDVKSSASVKNYKMLRRKI